MNAQTPLICNLGVFTPAQREAHIQTATQLMQAKQDVRKVQNGYEFRFPSKSELIAKTADFIANERLCCPFLTFTLNVASSSESFSLALTGPVGTQEFLRAEFDGAIP